MKSRFAISRTLSLLLGFQCAMSFSNQPATVAEQFLQGEVDLKNDTLTLPLYKGSLRGGKTVWYILTDASTRSEAQRLGVSYSPQLTNAAGNLGTREGFFQNDGTLSFSAGTVDFSPERSLTPGEAPNLFPPKAAKPGSIGDASYSPFVKVISNDGIVVYNAPMLAFNVEDSAIDFCNGNVDHTKVHDHVVSICPSTRSVTVRLSHGFASKKKIVYLSFDSDSELAATMEASTYAPALANLRGTGSDLDIYAVANGQTGTDNHDRQGFNSALLGEGSPLNVVEALPSNQTGYSPLWNLNVGVWTDAAIQDCKRHQLTTVGDFTRSARDGDLAGLGGMALGPVGIYINCPVVARLSN